MRILLTVVVGYIDLERTMLRTKAFTEVFVCEGDKIAGTEIYVCNGDQLAKAITCRVEEIRKSWPKECPGLQNIISVSHCAITT
jgi:hypothetical protein